jgi:hypothetical protein
MSTLSAQAFPECGLRQLTPKEIMQRAKALNCSVPKANLPSCVGQVHLGLFFDGTGNNMQGDYVSRPPAMRKHSNVVKLFNAYPANNDDGYFSAYIPGVGTPFPEIEDSGTNKFGGAFAWDGETRIIWAFTRLLNTVYRYVIKGVLIDDELAGRISRSLASSSTPAFWRRNVLRKWQKDLASSLEGKKPQVGQINISIFGFSRGAAEARAFCNWLMEVCDHVGGGRVFAGIPVRIGFLGIFDTVASVGIPDTFTNSVVEGHQSWADGNMQINPAVEQCVHFVAGHEVRAAFPLDSVRVEATYPANAREVMYPGAHSDLGGGYPANAVGIAAEISTEMARIPGAQMYKEARLAGVPLISWDRLRETHRADFMVATGTAIEFNKYVESAKIAPGAVEDVHRQHMSLYLSYRYKYRNAIDALPFYRRASAQEKAYIRVTTHTFNKRLRHLSGYPIPPTDESFDLRAAIVHHKKFTKAAVLDRSEQRQILHLYTIASEIRPEFLKPELENFFGNFVHDSMAGFIGMGGASTNEYLINGLGILKFRKIFKGNG